MRRPEQSRATVLLVEDDRVLGEMPRDGLSAGWGARNAGLNESILALAEMATSVCMWYFVRRRALKPRSEWTVTLDEHLAWMKRQHDTGKILMSGPTPDRQYGQYLVRADTRAEAEAIAASDPFTAAGFTTYEIIEWEIHQIMGIGAFTADGLGLPRQG